MFGWFKKPKKEAFSETFARDAFAALQFRKCMDLLSEDRGQSIPVNTESRNVYEAAAVAAYVTEQALLRSGVLLATLAEEELDVVALMALTAADHMSRVAAAPFPLVSVLAFRALFAEVIGENATGSLLRRSSEAFNLVNARGPSRTLVEFGTLVAQFFSNNDDGALQTLAQHLKVTLSLAKQR